MPRPPWFLERFADANIEPDFRARGDRPEGVGENLTILAAVRVSEGPLADDRGKWSDEAWMQWEAYHFAGDAYVVNVEQVIAFALRRQVQMVNVPCGKQRVRQVFPFKGKHQFFYSAVSLQDDILLDGSRLKDRELELQVSV